MREAGAARIYLDVIDIDTSDETMRLLERDGIVPVLDEVCREGDHARLDSWVRSGRCVAVGSVSELTLARERGAVAEVRGCIPAHNVAALRTLAAMGARFAWLSPELSLAQACELASFDELPVGVTVYGRPRLMTCEHCVLQVSCDCDHDHEHCKRRLEPRWLVNIDDRALPVRTDARGRSRVYLDEPVDLTPRAAELARGGVSRLLVDARLASDDEARGAIARLHRALSGEVVPCEGLPGLSDCGVE